MQRTFASSSFKTFYADKIDLAQHKLHVLLGPTSVKVLYSNLVSYDIEVLVMIFKFINLDANIYIYKKQYLNEFVKDLERI